MTVCVAAICEGHRIIGASDRMLTAVDVQFEPQQSKILTLTNSVAIMIAGDSSVQSEIIQRVVSDVNARITADPAKWWDVRDIAELYEHYFKELRSRRAANALLSPLGLDANTFITRQRELAPEVATKLATELINFEVPAVSAIIAGLDVTGAHIYIVDNMGVSCHDGVGFAAIGVGCWHANSQIMFAGHTRARPFPETLLLAHSAKKRAEVAPGVGRATDMFSVGPNLGSLFVIGDHVIGKLDEFYAGVQERERTASQQAETDVNIYVEEITRASVAKEQASIPAKDSSGDAPVN